MSGSARPGGEAATVRFNLHNHTTRSDGAARPEQIAEAAAESGLTHVGISDHLRSTKLSPGRALAAEALPEYVEEIHSLHARWRDRVLVLAGLEVNFSLLGTDFTFLASPELRAAVNSLDYVLFEYVNDAEWGGLGLEELLKVRPLLEIPVGLAHNDLTRNFGDVVQPEVLARILAQAHVFVELCPTRRNARPASGAGRLHVPYYRVEGEFNRRFWPAARTEGVLVSIGCDAHADLRDVGAVDDATSFLEECGLEANALVRHFWSGRE